MNKKSCYPVFILIQAKTRVSRVTKQRDCRERPSFILNFKPAINDVFKLNSFMCLTVEKYRYLEQTKN